MGELNNLREIFPNALSILEMQSRSKEEILKQCIFVIDSSALLAPFSVNKDDIDKITEVYGKLQVEKRVFIPEHAIREFAKNRGLKFSELYTAIDNLTNTLPSIKLPKYPILDQFSEYAELLELSTTLKETVKIYKERLESIKRGISNWNWNDPVSNIYSSLFKESIISNPSISDEDIEKEYHRRIKHNIPPGNKDKNKTFNAIGDYLIWMSILEFGKSNNSDIVLVTNDEKNDWQLKGNKKSIATRFELVEEYNRTTNGQNFVCINFEEFLNANGLQIEIQNFLPYPNYVPTDGPRSWWILESLQTIFKSYLEISEFEDFIDDPISSIKENIDNLIDKFWPIYSSEFRNQRMLLENGYNLNSTLKKISSLNYRITYEEHRMKKDTTNESREMIELVKKALEEISKIIR